ncbi:hypothetical protein HPB52_017273 [Rhipicephalus sanguineus]|uniref:Uncharacterized protein n=1 Tax=Rhipicephalus sanguineus TaxID=34632 RepID=A0A9D4QBJ4_RHISA|nr:hypothetical protein HPB52_017273 [Rhipicephalus sanguineus]
MQIRTPSSFKSSLEAVATTDTSPPSLDFPTTTEISGVPDECVTLHNKRGRRCHQLDFVRQLQRAAREPQGATAMILYRPKSRKNYFLALTRDSIAAQLPKVPGARQARVNFRRSVVAVDMSPGAGTTALLSVIHRTAILSQLARHL